MQNKSVSPAIGSSGNLQKNFDSHDEKENNSSSLNKAILNKSPLIKSKVDLTDLNDSAQHTGNDSSIPDLHSTVFGSPSTVNVFGHTQDKDLIGGKRINSKGKPQPDVLENVIGKVASFLENRCVPVSLSPSPLKPEIEEDIAFCQLILSLFVNMSQSAKADRKKEIMRILFDF